MGIFWVWCFVLPLKCEFRGGLSPWRLLICDPMDRDWGGHPGECGYVTPGEWSEGSHPGDCGIVSAVAILGKGSPWRLWTCDSRYSVWEGSPRGL